MRVECLQRLRVPRDGQLDHDLPEAEVRVVHELAGT